jgi:hypothetical protein
MVDDPFIGYSAAGLRFDRLLGKGGMGAVYQGEQLSLNRTVAIKVIAPHLAADSRYVERFTREARTLGRLVHPRIIACHDFGPAKNPAGEPILLMIMEYVDGWSLGGLARQSRLTVKQVLELHAQAAEGLAFAHGLGVIHRDIKPDNLMVTRSGQAKLADFGLARAEDSVQVTATGAIVGSPAYMSPEACRGQEPTARSDLYSLGCSLYQLLTDRPPFTGSTSLAVINQHIHDPVPTLTSQRPDLPLLQPLISRLLAKRPEDRPESATAVMDHLRALANQVDPVVPAGRIRRQPPATHITGAGTQLSGTAVDLNVTVPTLVEHLWRRWLVVSACALSLGLVIFSGVNYGDQRQGRRQLEQAIDRVLEGAEDDLAAQRHEAAEGRLGSLDALGELTTTQLRRLEVINQGIEVAKAKIAREAKVAAEAKAAREIAEQEAKAKEAERREQAKLRRERERNAEAPVEIQRLRVEGPTLGGLLQAGLAPLVPDGIRGALFQEGEYRIRLRANDTEVPRPGTAGEVMVLVSSSRDQAVRMVSVHGGRRQELAVMRAPAQSWFLFRSPLSTERTYEISARDGTLAVAGAVVVRGRAATWNDLDVQLGSLVNPAVAALQARRPEYRFDAKSVRLVVPRNQLAQLPSEGQPLTELVARGLGTATGARLAPPSISAYDIGGEAPMRTVLRNALLNEPSLVLFMPPPMVPIGKLRQLLELQSKDLSPRTMLVLLLAPDRPRPKEDLRESPVPVIDLGAHRDFLRDFSRDTEAGAPWGPSTLASLQAGLHQLRECFGASSLPSEPKARTP